MISVSGNLSIWKITNWSRLGWFDEIHFDRFVLKWQFKIIHSCAIKSFHEVPLAWTKRSTCSSHVLATKPLNEIIFFFSHKYWLTLIFLKSFKYLSSPDISLMTPQFPFQFIKKRNSTENEIKFSDVNFLQYPHIFDRFSPCFKIHCNCY